MRITFLILSVFLSLVTLENSRGQFYDTGTDPASIKWYQIKTDNYRIVFPHSYMKGAGTTAQTLERAYQSLSGTYEEGKRRYRTNVIIHSYSTESNGYVAWAPRRMELYPSPQQNSIPQSHNRQLLFHESVHVRQLKSLEQGFSGFMNLILGQQFTGILSVLVPEWFFEGDAVYYETLLNPGGRGQNPAFNKDIKALYGAKPSGFSYDKMLFGSYRDHTPNHYQFGSLMMEYSRSKYGADLWKNTLSYTAKFPFLLNPVNLKLNSTEKLKKKLFKETFNNLHADWEKERLLDNSIEYNSVSPIKEESYINYHSPVVISSDSIFAIKTSLYKPSSIVLIKDNGISEETITMPGIMYPYLLAGGGGKLTWAEHAPDPRWENRNYSVIVVYDLKTKMSRRITSRTRYTAPSLSSNGMFIAASENSVEDANSLVMINSMDGEIIRKIPTPDNGFPQRPRWSDDDSLITVILLTDNGEGVFNYSIYKDKWEQLLPPEHTDLQDALVRNDTLFFVSSITGTDNLFIRDKEGSVSRITRSQFGLSNFSLDGNEVIFSDYTAQGNYLGAASIKGDGYPYFKPGKTPSSETEAVSDSNQFSSKTIQENGPPFQFSQLDAFLCRS